MRQRRVARVEHAGEIRVDHVGPLLERHRRDVCEHTDAGVVDHEIEAAESRDRRVDRASDVLVPSDIRLHRLDRAGTGRFDRRPRRRQMRGAAAGDGHLHAVGDERARDRKADAARSAGDERHFPAE